MKIYQKIILLILSYNLTFAITADQIYNQSWALIIGIDEYKNVKNLDYASNDALMLKKILTTSFNFPDSNITLMLNQEATKQNILQSFSNIAINANKGDRVLIFFAGHGETMDLPEGGEMGYIMPYEGSIDNLYMSAIGMDEFRKISSMSKAKHILYLIDACYGGLAAVGTRGLEPNIPNYIEKITIDDSRQIITAGGRNEKVIEKAEWGHSAFSLNLKRGLENGRADLNADGIITTNELALFLQEKVSIDSENQQTPQYNRFTTQEGEFVFVFSDNTVVNNSININPNKDKLDVMIAKMESLEKKLSSPDNPKSLIESNPPTESYKDSIKTILKEEFDQIDFHYMNYTSIMNDSQINRLESYVIGTQYNFNNRLGLQIGYRKTTDEDKDDSFWSSEHHYQSKGLRFGIIINIIDDFVSSIGGVSIEYSEYDPTGEFENDIVGYQTYTFDLGVEVSILGFAIPFSYGYHLNDLKNLNNEYLIQGSSLNFGISF